MEPYRLGLSAKRGTPDGDMLYSIFAKAVRDGVAERV